MQGLVGSSSTSSARTKAPLRRGLLLSASSAFRFGATRLRAARRTNTCPIAALQAPVRAARKLFRVGMREPG